MEGAPLPSKTPKESISVFFDIKQDDNSYKLNIKVINQDIILNILENTYLREYEIKLTLDELKQIHKIFVVMSSFQEFIDYIKALIENKKLSIKKDNDNENQITIELTVEYLYKQNLIKIDLHQKASNFELISLDLYKKISVLNENFKNLENNYNSIKEENKSLREENINIKNRIKNLEDIISSLKEEKSKMNNKNEILNSEIIEKNELDMILSEIKSRMNKEIKETKKIYQATRDGDEPLTFHKKCDNIANTLVLYKSEGNRRFGGFTSESWTSEEETKLDKNCFLFSLDQKKIYPPKNNNYYQIKCSPDLGPSFLIKGLFFIKLLDKKKLFTFEGNHKEIFNGELNALSEDGNFKGVYSKEYEVYQIIF